MNKKDKEADKPLYKGIINTDKILAYTDAWPLIAHLFSGTFCMGCSATFHLCYIKSPTVLSLMSRLDYAGISILIIGSMLGPCMYVFACEPVFFMRNVFMSLITLICLAAFFITMIPSFQQPRWRSMRAIIYIVAGLSAGLPFFYLQLNMFG